MSSLSLRYLWPLFHISCSCFEVCLENQVSNWKSWHLSVRSHLLFLACIKPSWIETVILTCPSILNLLNSCTVIPIWHIQPNVTSYFMMGHLLIYRFWLDSHSHTPCVCDILLNKGTFFYLWNYHWPKYGKYEGASPLWGN